MSPNSLAAQLAALALALLVALATAWSWHRVHAWWGWIDRSVALLLCAATALGAASIAVNRELNLYTSWSQLLGQPDQLPGDGRTQTVEQGAGGSRVVQFSLTGPSSGISLAAYAYLPPGYDSPAGSRTRYPVIEAVDGFPGSPNTWLISLEAGRYLDAEITQGRMAPTVVIFPTQVLDPTRDSECVNAVGGTQFETYLTTDLHQAVTGLLRVRTDRAGWSIIGTSTGGFCAVNLALRHPDLYAAAASLSGYFTALTDHTTGDLYRGNTLLREQNSPIWRVRHLPVPPLPLYIASARDDRDGYQQLRTFATAVRAPIDLTTIVVPQGGHTGAVWKTLEPSAFDWLSGWMAAPEINAVTGPVVPLPTHGPVIERISPVCRPATPVPSGAAVAPPLSTAKPTAASHTAPLQCAGKGG